MNQIKLYDLLCLASDQQYQQGNMKTSELISHVAEICSKPDNSKNDGFHFVPLYPFSNTEPAVKYMESGGKNGTERWLFMVTVDNNNIDIHAKPASETHSWKINQSLSLEKVQKYAIQVNIRDQPPPTAKL